MESSNGPQTESKPDNEPTTQPNHSWIDQFCKYTDGIPSPQIFRKWAAIAAISAALERRCYTSPNGSPLYPNLFVFLVGRPGVGKTQALSHALNIIRSVNEIKVAPDDSTKAALTDFLSDTSSRNRLTLPDGLFEYHSILAVAHELGVLIKEHDLEMLSFLSALYDCPTVHEERRRHRKGDDAVIRVPHPSLTFVAGTTPGYLSSVFPEAAWSQGFMARTICIYSADVIRPPLFGQKIFDKSSASGLITKLHQIAKLSGEFTWTPEAVEAISRWYDAECPPIPKHGRLANYATRRPIQAVKLCMIFCAARTTSMEINHLDVADALETLINAEAVMPEIFLEMSGNSDAAVIQELHFYLMQTYLKNKAAIHKSRVLWFLTQKAPAWRANSILDLCIDANIIIRQSDPEFFIPNVAHQFGARK